MAMKKLINDPENITKELLSGLVKSHSNLIKMVDHDLLIRTNPKPEGKVQIVTTTHSPQLLGMLSADACEHASLVYRFEGDQEGRIRRILDIPEAKRVLEEQNLARLHESGWLEDAVAFVESAEANE